MMIAGSTHVNMLAKIGKVLSNISSMYKRKRNVQKRKPAFLFFCG
jgi:hypothetical protein